MRYEKLAAGLASALETAKNELDPSKKIFLFVYIADQIYTASFSPQAIEELSEQWWVKRISLGQHMRPLEHDSR